MPTYAYLICLILLIGGTFNYLYLTLINPGLKHLPGGRLYMGLVAVGCSFIGPLAIIPYWLAIRPARARHQPFFSDSQ